MYNTIIYILKSIFFLNRKKNYNTKHTHDKVLFMVIVIYFCFHNNSTLCRLQVSFSFLHFCLQFFCLTVTLGLHLREF